MTRQQIIFRCLVLLEFEELEYENSLEEDIEETLKYLKFTYRGSHVPKYIIRKVFPMLLEWDYRIKDTKYKKSVLKAIYWRCDSKREYTEIPKHLEKFENKSSNTDEDFI